MTRKQRIIITEYVKSLTANQIKLNNEDIIVTFTILRAFGFIPYYGGTLKICGDNYIYDAFVNGWDGVAYVNRTGRQKY